MLVHPFRVSLTLTLIPTLQFHGGEGADRLRPPPPPPKKKLSMNSLSLGPGIRCHFNARKEVPPYYPLSENMCDHASMSISGIMHWNHYNTKAQLCAHSESKTFQPHRLLNRSMSAARMSLCSMTLCGYTA